MFWSVPQVTRSSFLWQLRMLLMLWNSRGSIFLFFCMGRNIYHIEYIPQDILSYAGPPLFSCAWLYISCNGHRLQGIQSIDGSLFLLESAVIHNLDLHMSLASKCTLYCVLLFLHSVALHRSKYNAIKL